MVGPGYSPGNSWISAESPVPPHPYANAHSGTLGTASENSCIGCLLGPTGSMESGSMYILLWPLGTLGCSWEQFLHWHLQGGAGGQGSSLHAHSPSVLWRAALAPPAYRFMNVPCELGSFLVLLMDNSGQQGRTAGSPAGHKGMGRGQGSA